MLLPLGKTKRLPPALALRCHVSPGAESLICPGSGYILPPRPAQRPLGRGAAVRPGIYRVTNAPEDRWFPINVFNHVDCGSRQSCVPGGTGSGNPGVRQRSEAGDTFAAGKRRLGMKSCQGRHPASPTSPGAWRWVCSCGERVGNVLPAPAAPGSRARRVKGGHAINLLGSCGVFQCFSVWHSWAVPILSPVAIACLLAPCISGKKWDAHEAVRSQDTKNGSCPFPPIPKLAAGS